MKSKQAKTKQALATLVMGLNLVNTMTPMAMAMQSLPEGAQALPVQQTEAQPLDYAVLPHTVEFVDSVIFSKAEAYSSYYVNSGETSNISNISEEEYLNINSGGTANVTNLNGSAYYKPGWSSSAWVGHVTLANGAVANITNISGGELRVSSYWDETKATVGTLDGSMISSVSGNYLHNESMYIGKVIINGLGSNNASASIETMNGGFVDVASGGVCTIKNMNGGYVNVGSKSILNDTVINGGTVLVECTATVDNISLRNSGTYLLKDDLTAQDNSFQPYPGYYNSPFKIGTLNVAGGTVNMAADFTNQKYTDLNIDTLKGGGATFIMETNLDGDYYGKPQGDKIIINNANAGTNYISVVDNTLWHKNHYNNCLLYTSPSPRDT